MKTVHFTLDKQFATAPGFIDSPLDLFTLTAVEPGATFPANGFPKAFKYSTKYGGNAVSSFVRLTDHREGKETRYYQLALTERAKGWVMDNTLPNDDLLSLEIIVRKDGSMLYTLSHNKILASYWLILDSVEKCGFIG